MAKQSDNIHEAMLKHRKIPMYSRRVPVKHIQTSYRLMGRQWHPRFNRQWTPVDYYGGVDYVVKGGGDAQED